ncbi:MAG: hypothetical protein V3U30_01460 [Thermoplasmata archaeon]
MGLSMFREPQPLWKRLLGGGAVVSAVGLFSILAALYRVAAGCQSGECTGAFVGTIFGVVILVFGVAVMIAAVVAFSRRD